jgi:predicted dehydrogenase
MTPLRVGVVGVGHLGQHHARILAGLPEVKLVAVVDSRPDRANAIANRCATAALTDHRDLLDAVDAVTIAVPTAMHREVAAPFLERGTATLVEKPLARSTAEAEGLVQQARASGALLQVGHVERFNPVLAALGQLPLRPRFVSADRLSGYTFRSTDIGVVLDLMIHDLDLLLSLIPAPVRAVAAVGASLFGGHEDVANARIEFDDGSVANLTASRVSYVAVRKMRLWAAEGYASLDFSAKQATLVYPSQPFASGQLELDGPDSSEPAAVKDYLFGKVLRVANVCPEGGDPLALELENFVAAARGLAPPMVSGADALGALRLADQILRSLEAHRWDAGGASTAAAGLSPPVEPASVLRGPHAWRLETLRHSSAPSKG